MTLGPLMIDVAGTELTAEDRALLKHPLVGGAILFTRNYESPEQLRQLVAAIHGLRTPPLLVAVDQEGGRVQRFRPGFTRLPPMRAIGRAHDVDPESGRTLAWQYGWLMAAELRAVGVDLSFAPCVDLDYGVSEVIGDRAFHRSPEVVARLATATLQGMRAAGMAGTAKHFPGHGAVVADSHQSLPVDRRGLADLDEDLRPYRQLIANGLASVMVAHVQFPAIDPAPASLSSRWVQRELRWALGFTGAVFTDDLSMGGAAAEGDIVERVQKALAAGCDVLPICNDRAAVQQVLQALEGRSDPLSQVRLARLHGRPLPDAELLTTTPRWRECRATLDRCQDAPPLQLDA